MATLDDLRAGRLAGTRRLDLSCGLTDFPSEIYALADSLEVLNLSGNALDRLPDDLHRLHRLTVLFCSDNRFTELPPSLGRCARLQMVGFKANQIGHVPAEALPPALRWLILTDNRLESLPDELGRRPALQKLMLAGNRLRALPDLSACRHLELLRVAGNRLARLPDWLLEMPALAWLAFEGNPMGAERPVVPVRDIDWCELTLEHTLGEGTSGLIQQARWQPESGDPRIVAVKLYKSEVTSDGSPLDEMAACLVAGNHPGLIGVEGRVRGHPQGRVGLVMPRVPPHFSNLAGPPSLVSCTRDVYAEGQRFSLAQVLSVAHGIASVTAHLHECGMSHGDLYGHNTLHSEGGECLLGDFGAASFFPDTRSGAALARFETRAFGILLGELLERCEALASPITQALSELQLRCTQPQVSRRPDMAEVAATLEALRP